jgi:hypothetical protein
MKYKKWSDTELSYIKHHSADIPDKYIAQKMTEMGGTTITADMIRRQRRNLKIVKSKGRPPKHKANDQ